RVLQRCPDAGTRHATGPVERPGPPAPRCRGDYFRRRRRAMIAPATPTPRSVHEAGSGTAVAKAGAAVITSASAAANRVAMRLMIILQMRMVIPRKFYARKNNPIG